MRNVARYWWTVAKVAFAKSAKAVGFAHPKSWPLAIALWVLTSALYYWFSGKADEVVSGGVIAICGIVGAAILIVIIGVAQLAIVPAELQDAAIAKLVAVEVERAKDDREAKNARLEIVRKTLLHHCDNAPNRENSNPDTEHDWMSHADELLGRTVKPATQAKLQRFIGGSSDHTKLRKGIASLQAIAANLLVDDLK